MLTHLVAIITMSFGCCESLSIQEKIRLEVNNPGWRFDEYLKVECCAVILQKLYTPLSLSFLMTGESLNINANATWQNEGSTTSGLNSSTSSQYFWGNLCAQGCTIKQFGFCENRPFCIVLGSDFEKSVNGKSSCKVVVGEEYMMEEHAFSILGSQCVHFLNSTGWNRKISRF